MRTKSFDQDKALDKAMIQFWRSGYQGASMQLLVEAMGISRQSLYDTYGNKHALFLSSLEQYYKNHLGPDLALLEEPGTAPAVALRRYLEAIIERGSDVPAGCLATRTATEFEAEDEEVRQALEQLSGKVFDALTSLVRRGQAAGEFNHRCPAPDQAACILMVAQGLNVMRRLPAGRASLNKAVDCLMNSLAAE